MCGAGCLLPPQRAGPDGEGVRRQRNHLPEYRQPDEEQPEQPGGNAGRCQPVSAPANHF